MRIERPRRLTGPELAKFYPAVLCDLDGTICNSSVPAIWELKSELIKHLFGWSYHNEINLSAINIHEIAAWKQLETWLKENAPGIPEATIKKLNEDIWNRRVVLERAKPVEGMPELIDWFKTKQRKPVFVATSRPKEKPGVEKTTLEWIWNHCRIPPESVFINDDSTTSSGPDFKASVAIALVKLYGAVLYFEDFPGHLERILELTRGYNVHGVLSTYGKIRPSAELLAHPEVTFVPRDPDQNLIGLFESFTGRKPPGY